MPLRSRGTTKLLTLAINRRRSASKTMTSLKSLSPLPRSVSSKVKFSLSLMGKHPFFIDVFASSVDNPLCAPCDEAPANYCIDDNILALYEKTLESCGEGMCLYVAQDVLCNIGCDRETGACISLDAGVNTGGSNNNNNANDNDGGALPADNDVVADGGYNPDSQGTNDTENDGGTNAQATAAYQVAQANSTTCYTCSDWENPISCDVSEANCTSTQGIGYGQEYHYDNSHELAFLEIEGRLLKDTNTGLTWSRCANGSLNDPCDTNTQPQNFASATALCQQRAAYEGASFRLPSLGELLTLINYQSSLTVLGDANFMWPSGLYWTTDQVQPTNPLTNYWVINTVEQKLSENTVQDQAHVLCVSGVTHGESGLLDQAGDIFDSRTQLLWQRCRYGQSLNSAGECIGAVIQLPFHDALAQCESRVTENGADWRLPSIRELTTMALYPETPDLFRIGSAEEGLLGQLWSGTPHFTDTAIWVFNPTGPYWQKGGSSQPLRCVRSP